MVMAVGVTGGFAQTHRFSDPVKSLPKTECCISTRFKPLKSCCPPQQDRCLSKRIQFNNMKMAKPVMNDQCATSADVGAFLVTSIARFNRLMPDWVESGVMIKGEHFHASVTIRSDKTCRRCATWGQDGSDHFDSNQVVATPSLQEVRRTICDG